jgi:hypothetical protein
VGAVSSRKQEAQPALEAPPPVRSALREVRTSTHARALAALLAVWFLLALLALLVPWQQTARSAGKVIAWHPQRPAAGDRRPGRGSRRERARDRGLVGA